jgi:hypothetical protein
MSEDPINIIGLPLVIDTISSFYDAYRTFPITTHGTNNLHILNKAQLKNPYIDIVSLDLIDNSLFGNHLLFTGSPSKEKSFDFDDLISLRPRGVLSIIELNDYQNDSIIDWIDNDYNGYSLVHQVSIQTQSFTRFDPRLIWMTRKDCPIKIKSVQTIIPKIYEFNDSNTICSIM